MNILFTGASSFTGYWFVKNLTESGHSVTVTLRKKVTEYDGIKRLRVEELAKIATVAERMTFGTKYFLELVNSQAWDIFCHHAATTEKEQPLKFDFIAALKNNTRNVNMVLENLAAQGCNKLLLTGANIEPNEGRGTEPLRAFSPYGLSKGLTWEVFRYFAFVNKIKMFKFIVPTPFGPLEDSHSPTFVIKAWLGHEIPTVSTPRYIRDYMHVDLLARTYAAYVDSILTNNTDDEKFSPSGYIEAQSNFTNRIAVEMRQRIKRPCDFAITDQNDFPQPIERANVNQVIPDDYGFDIKDAWDKLAEYYLKMYPEDLQDQHDNTNDTNKEPTNN